MGWHEASLHLLLVDLLADTLLQEVGLSLDVHEALDAAGYLALDLVQNAVEVSAHHCFIGVQARAQLAGGGVASPLVGLDVTPCLVVSLLLLQD